jgi:hypothetical protein
VVLNAAKQNLCKDKTVTEEWSTQAAACAIVEAFVIRLQ